MQEVISKQRPLTDGLLVTNAWSLSWPLLLNMMVLAASNLVEGWIAGRLGPDVQAAVGLGSQIWFLMMLLTLAFSAGTTAIVSRYWGSGNYSEALMAGRQALAFSFIFSAAMTIAVLTFSFFFSSLIGGSASLSQTSWAYLRSTALSMTPYTVLWISNSIFRARGDSRTPMSTMLIVTAVTIALELILCLTPFAVGVGGIGIAWLVASTLGLVINFRHMQRSDLADCLNGMLFWEEKLCIVWLKRLLKIGMPACLQDLSLVTSSFGIFYILSQTDHALVDQAVWAAGWRVEEVLVIMPMYGLSMAAATLVGQNLGAEMPERAKTAGWLVTILGIAMVTAMSSFIHMGAPLIANFMSSDCTVSRDCVAYLRSVSISEPFFASWLILAGAMQGAGYTKMPMVATICCFNILRVGLAWYLCIHAGLGANSVWLAMAISAVAAGLTMVWLWQKNEWQSIGVFSH